MKKACFIIVIVIAALILIGIIVELLLQKQEAVKTEKVLSPEEKFHSYLELPSLSGKFLEFDEVKSEISILYLNTETMKIAAKIFKIDQETIFSKVAFELYGPNIFPKKGLKEVKQEIQTTVFYLPSEEENEIPIARLIQVETSF